MQSRSIKIVLKIGSISLICLLEVAFARLAHDGLTCLYLIVPLSSTACAVATPAAPPSILLLHASIIPTTKQAKLNSIAYEIYFKLLANCIEYVLLLYTAAYQQVSMRYTRLERFFTRLQIVFLKFIKKTVNQVVSKHE